MTERRPTRAYSVGSRTEHNKRKLRVELLAAEHNNRARAFSVGSRAKMPRSELYRGVIQTALLSNIAQEHAANATNNNGKSSKSLSAPMLVQKGPGSIDPMDDLMEIDFTSKTSIDNCASNKTMSQPVTVPVKRFDELSNIGLSIQYGGGSRPSSGYVEMRPGANHQDSAIGTNQYGYMEMKPVGSSGGSSASVGGGGSSSRGDNYPHISSPSTSPLRSITSSKVILQSSGGRNNNYMDMTPRSLRQVDHPISASPQGSSDDYLNMSPIGSTHNDDKAMEVDLPKILSAPEGYLEMSWGKSAAGSSASSTSTVNNNNNSCSGGGGGGGSSSSGNNSNNNLLDKPSSDEYINMNFKEVGNSSEPRTSSLPIAIQQFNKFSQDMHKIGNIPTSNSLHLGGLLTKGSRSRCDSKDSGIVTPSDSHTSIFPFSPASPSKQFVGTGEENNLPRKCMVDASTGTVRLSEDHVDGPNMPWFPSTSTTTPTTTPIDGVPSQNPIAEYMDLSTSSGSTNLPPVDVLSNNYADMTLRSTKNDSVVKKLANNHKTDASSEYVNCGPQYTSKQSPTVQKSLPLSCSSSGGEYAIVNPALMRRLNPVDQSLSLTSPNAPLSVDITMTTTSIAAQKKSILVTIGGRGKNNVDKLPTSSTSGFKPISTIDEQQLTKGTSTTTSNPSTKDSWRPRFSASTFSRQLSERISLQAVSPATTIDNSGSDASGYELLQMRSDISMPYQGRILSRPNSVNSEKISSPASLIGQPNSTRPNSANSDRLPTISTSSSSSTLCGSSSSSQTLCYGGGGSKSQSPLTTTIRPQSFTENDSRVESVIGASHIASRPPSVSSERELHYASLDLPPPTSSNKLEVDIASAAASSATTAAAKSNSMSGDSSSSSPSPNANTETHQEQPTFTYAQIDFIKSENINASNSSGSGGEGSIASSSSTYSTTTTITTNEQQSQMRQQMSQPSIN